MSAMLPQTLIERLAQLPDNKRKAIMGKLSDQQCAELIHDWRFTARPKQIAPDGDWRVWFLCTGRGFGKMVADETPIPTPDGWSTMGGIKVGDKVFDEAGHPCRVTAKFAPVVDEQYRLTFSDETFIDACADHQWVTWNAAERKAFSRSPYENTSQFPRDWPIWKLRRKLDRHCLGREIIENALKLFATGMSARKIAQVLKCSRQALTRHIKSGKYLVRDPVVQDDSPGPKIRTTKEIFATLTVGSRGDTNHCIPCTDALVMPEADLPVPPYTLGAWLGDGSTSDGTITSHQDDMPFMRQHIENEGIPITLRKHPQSFGTIGLTVLLRKAGLIQNKHVPDIYLRSSAIQRLQLLRGLMDTDGNIEHCNTVAFVNTNKRLIDAVQELVHSLGMKTRVWSGIGKCNGKVGKQFWRVQFTPTVNPFLLPRKADRIKLNGNQSLRNHHRMIVAAERISTVPMSCITVDGKNSMYLVGKAMIPTHNTRAGAEWVREQIKLGVHRVHMIAPTAADARDVMVEGDSGILACCWDNDYTDDGQFMGRPHYEPSKRRITWDNGAIATLFSAEEPERLRGPQCGALWADELAAWQHVDATWDMAQFGLRIGQSPRTCVTTTPKPIGLIVKMMKDQTTVITRGSTFENAANLSPEYLESIRKRYHGTRLGRQELDGEVLEDMVGALWTMNMFDDQRVDKTPDMARIVVAVDPSGTRGDSDSGDQIGIIVAGMGVDGRGYVLADRTCKLSPDGWGRRAVAAYHEFSADRIVAERNFGGAMVEHVIRTVDPDVSYKEVTASRGKVARAEPIAAMYEQKRISHVGRFDALEDQACLMGLDGFAGEGSPDRCFVAGTMVETIIGPVPIEKIRGGDYVLTTAGYKKVLASEKTSDHSVVGRVRFSNGVELIGTENHPISTHEYGFIHLSGLLCGDVIVTMDDVKCREKKSNTTGKSMQDFPNPTRSIYGIIISQLKNMVRLYIEIFMKPKSARSKRDTISTTRIVTRWTIGLKISLHLALRPISKPMLTMTRNFLNILKSEGNILITSDLWRHIGMVARKGLSGIESMVLKHMRGVCGEQKRVLFASVNTRQSIFTVLTKRSSVVAEVASIKFQNPRENLSRKYALYADHGTRHGQVKEVPYHAGVSVVQPYEKLGTAAVYNLTVDGQNEYFANSILVHNCDAMVWGLTELMLGGPGPSWYVGS